MFNKNTVISQIINILENKKNKELKSYITMFLFKDNDTNKSQSDIGVLFDGNEKDILTMYFTLTKILATHLDMDVDVFCKTTQDIITRGENVCDINIYKRCQI